MINQQSSQKFDATPKALKQSIKIGDSDKLKSIKKIDYFSIISFIIKTAKISIYSFV